MKQLKLAAALLVTSSCFITLLLYYWNRATLPNRKTSLSMKIIVTEKYVVDKPMVHVNLDDIYHDMSKQSLNESFELYDYKEGKINLLELL